MAFGPIFRAAEKNPEKRLSECRLGPMT